MIKREVKDDILIITIDRPKAMNALNTGVMDGLKEVFIDDVEVTRNSRGVIITGCGNKAFAAGADITEFPEYNVEQGKALSQKGHDIFSAIENSSIPVIAAVNGFALGGGCELAMACHMRIAEEHAKFGQPEINLGLIPGYGGTQRLIRYIGKPKAIELLLTGDMISADEALQWQLINKKVDKGEALAESFKIMEKIVDKSSVVVAKMLKAANAYHQYENAFDQEIETFGECFGLNDMKEGVEAFMDKRKPKFTGS
jgi:enoyl-CoA hydratase